MTLPVAPNLCHDLGCPDRGHCARWQKPADPRLGQTLFPADADIDDDCPHLVDLRQTDRS